MRGSAVDHSYEIESGMENVPSLLLAVLVPDE
jgi:hypothetical protein